MPSIERRLSLEIGLTTFAILVLELAVIRWMSQQIRVFAYLNNMLLIAAFLGMGIGLGLAARTERLLAWMLPLLAALAALLAFARPIGLMDLSFPDISIALWGAEGIRRGSTFAGTLLLIVALFVLVASVFVCGGNYVGALFRRMPPLRAYSADLFGSFLGVVAMAIAAALSTSPPVWFGIGCIAIIAVSRRVTDILATIAVTALTAYSMQGAQFSPYNRLDLLRENIGGKEQLVLAANRDFHQYLFDLSDRAVNDSRSALSRYMYDLPFRVTQRRERALVVGAGTGNDVAAALRNGFGNVVSVDIDPVIIRIGRSLHPEHPYSDPRTVAVVNDARNFFERYDGPPFDVVCFGLLDSHAMFSAMSTLRLDNYVYTRDGLAAAWKLVAPHGVMSITFQVWQGEWIADRIAAAMQEVTHQTPVIFGGEIRTFMVGKEFDLRGVAGRLPLRRPVTRDVAVRITTDDWPFLYLRPGVFPWGYAAVLTCVVAIALIAVRLVFGGGAYGQLRFDPAMFGMGAAFLLIETRGVTDLSLLFGSTWIVNSAVFGGVLLMAWLANAWIAHHAFERIELWFLPLLLSLAVSYWLRPSMLLALPYPMGGMVGAIVNALPIGFAAVIFSWLLAHSRDAAFALGSNLLGAVVGGCLEYVSIYAGLRSVTLIAAAFYLMVLLSVSRAPTADIATQS